jgi:hypothetical protein
VWGLMVFKMDWDGKLLKIKIKIRGKNGMGV